MAPWLSPGWLRRLDSNQRPSGYEPDELPLLHSAPEVYRQASGGPGTLTVGGEKGGIRSLETLRWYQTCRIGLRRALSR